jgi:hypothetical protein
MGSIFSTSEVDTNIKIIKHDDNISLGSLIDCKSSLLIITNQNESIIQLPDAVKLPGYNFKILNLTLTEKIINTSNQDKINMIHCRFKLSSRQFISIISDGISSWWIEGI